MLWRFMSRRRSSELEIARELRDHLALDAEALTRAGTPAGEAERHARRRFGNVTAAQEATRESWGSLWFERLTQDIAFGVRMLVRTPVFTIVATPYYLLTLFN